MNPTIFKSNIAELEGQINALKFKNSELEVNIVELKTSNKSLSKKAEWLETELVMSKHYCALLKNSIYGKRSEKSKVSHRKHLKYLDWMDRKICYNSSFKIELTRGMSHDKSYSFFSTVY